jgi:hypothetical protein
MTFTHTHTYIRQQVMSLRDFGIQNILHLHSSNLSNFELLNYFIFWGPHGTLSTIKVVTCGPKCQIAFGPTRLSKFHSDLHVVGLRKSTSP